MKWTIITLGALAAAGCQDRLELTHASCPCADGWVCCEGLDMCMTDVAECAGEAPGELDAAPVPGEPDAGDSAAGYAIYLAFEGGTVSPGADDAAGGTSSVVDDEVDLPAFTSTGSPPPSRAARSSRTCARTSAGCTSRSRSTSSPSARRPART